MVIIPLKFARARYPRMEIVKWKVALTIYSGLDNTKKETY